MPVFFMPTLPTQKSFLQKQIPTLLGLFVLVVALGAGLVFFSSGNGLNFSPRATPQTTPKNIRVSNVSDTSFTVSFLTDESTAGFIKYGKDSKSLKSQASDDRDQLSGNVGSYPLHHVTVRGLEPGVTYYYTLGTGSGATFDNNGAPFTITTAKRSGTPSAAKTVYGCVNTEAGTPAEGSVVYVSMPSMGEMSSLVKSSCSWAVPLSNARLADGSGYATVTDTDNLNITVQGPSTTQTSQLNTTVAQAQPVPNITFGQAITVAPAAPINTMTTANGTPTGTTPMASAEPAILPSPSPIVSTQGGGLSDLANASGAAATTAVSSGSSTVTRVSSGSATVSTSSSASASTTTATVVDLQKTTEQIVTTTTPVITGKAAPGVRVKIEVHSETQIYEELVADGNGGFSLDIATLSQQLEPGEHTVTYSYTDPATGKEVTKTQTFTVQPKTTLAQASTPGTGGTTKTSTSSAKASPSPSPSPFGSGNPFPIGGTATKSTQTATKSSTATSSGRTSIPSTKSAIPVSGSTETTLALLVGGFFFILAGAWSFWLAQQIEEAQEISCE
ncbi:MAG TPA: fibronectin type III domain-containing protein [Vitreimonas sp.]|nr:fibronectin type III domain-containing protein [Vitreimonas sp.]